MDVAILNNEVPKKSNSISQSLWTEIMLLKQFDCFFLFVCFVVVVVVLTNKVHGYAWLLSFYWRDWLKAARVTAQTLSIPPITNRLFSIHFCIRYYSVVCLHFSPNPVTRGDYNAIKTLFIIQLLNISVSLKHATLVLKAPLYGSEISPFCGDHCDWELNLRDRRSSSLLDLNCNDKPVKIHFAL